MADGAEMADTGDGERAEGRAEVAGGGAIVASAAGRSAGGLTDVEASATGGRTTSERTGASLGWKR
jgi:hypothetical protein